MEEAMGGLAVLAGFMLFFLVERIVRAHGSHSHGAHSHGAHSHGAHSHEHEHAGASAACEDCGHDHDHGGDEAHEHAAQHDHDHHHDADDSSSRGGRTLRKRRAASPAKRAPSAAKSKSKSASTAASPASSRAAAKPAAPAPASSVLISGYLNLAADGAHNFTDGLLLGGAFTRGFWQGVGTTIAVLMHEVPHEVGDVAILMQAGFTRAQAIRAQLGTAIAAMLGTAAAIYTGKTQAALLDNFTAGGFIYVATVDVLPPLLEQPSTLAHTAAQLGAMALGVGMMLAVIYFE